MWDLTIKTRHLNATGSELNHEFMLQAKFESSFDLDDIFIVLEMNSERAGKVLFLQEVGNLEAREPKTIMVIALLARESISFISSPADMRCCTQKSCPWSASSLG